MSKVTIDGNEYTVVYDASDILALDKIRNIASGVKNSDYVLIRKGDTSGSTPMVVPVENFSQSLVLLSGTEELKEIVTKKQDALVSGENIKTINGTSILGSGNIDLDFSNIDLDDYITKEEVGTVVGKKQDTLVSGENIKTIDGTSILGSGNIDLSNYATKEELEDVTGDKQDALVSGENIKTINGASILGSGDLTIKSTKVVDALNDLYTIDSGVAYVGMPVVVVEENAIYILKDLASIADADGWKKVGELSVTIDDDNVDLAELLSSYATSEQLTAQVERLTKYVDSSVEGASIKVDSEVTQNSERPVKSSGIYKAINAKCVYLTSAEYNAMDSHDENVFYFIKDD